MTRDQDRPTKSVTGRAGPSGALPPPRSGPDGGLVAAEKMWRLTLDYSPIGMAIVGLDGRFLRVNHALSRMLGYSSADMLLLTFQDITHPEDLEQDLSLLNETLLGLRSDYRMLKRYLHAQGSVVWGDLSVALLRDADGTPMHFVAQVVDMTEQRRDREELVSAQVRLEAQARLLARSNSELHDFAAIASHDLQAPLTVLHGYLECLSDDLEDMTHEETRALIERIRGAGARMSDLIGALLGYAQLGNEGSPRGPVELGEACLAAAEDLGPLINETDANLTLDARAHTEVLGSAPLLRTLVGNLISNAIKHRTPGDRCLVGVRVRPASDGTSIELLIEDNGPGIPVHERERLLQPFARGIAPTTSGHGLGLANCRRIVNWHTGSMELERSSLGGLAVRCRFPSSATTPEGFAS